MSLNKIYSRPRIRFHKNKKQKIKFLIFIIFIIILICLLIILRAAYPIFMSSCETEATRAAVEIVNSEVNKAISSYDYDDLVNIEKNSEGEVSYIEAKIVPINSLVSEITSGIQEQINNMENITVDLDFGSVSGISSLKLVSPKIDIKMESSGRIETEIKSEFEAVRNKSNFA